MLIYYLQYYCCDKMKYFSFLMLLCWLGLKDKRIMILKIIGLLFSCSCLLGIAIVNAFFFNKSVLESWPILLVLGFFLVPKCLFLIDPQRFQNFSFSWIEIQPYQPFYKYLEYSSYIALIFSSIYNIYYYEFII